MAAAVCLTAKKCETVMPCGQMLIYPSTGLDAQTESMKKYTDTPMCNSRDAAKYDKLYVAEGADRGDERLSPMAAESLENQPPAYVETAEFDCLRDGGILYAERLSASGVPTIQHNTVGTMHGYDIVLDSPIVRESVDKRIDFLNMIFGGDDK